ncbi:MAG: thiamine pyrophosphate-binding protein [Rhodospirillaceae bacterium]|nr:thiamine pyrophosphate-binding protein [Rhodospirillaceae bacterium]MCA8932750.1 thiamine pyrophosphate-binding protein [Rhodospirillaceae bacterium]
MRTGGQLVVDSLKAEGVRRVFCVPGESYLAVLDALYDSGIALTVSRQEGGAAFMADAWGKLTGRPGVAMVTRGPGATNAACGVHVAQHDGTPMLLLVGQVARGHRHRGAFQEVDYRDFFGGMAKWVAEVDTAERVPEMMSRAFHVAQSGRPGPVVLALPEDMLRETAETTAVSGRAPIARPAPASADLSRLAGLLAVAERPVLVLGGAPWTADAVVQIAHFAERQALPVVATFRRQMLFDHLHPNYAGDLGLGANPALIERIATADLLIVVGDALAEVPSQGYTLLDIPEPSQALVHVLPDAAELGRVYRPDLPIQANPIAFAAAVSRLPGASPTPARAERVAEAHAAYLAWSETVPEMPGRLQMAGVIEALRARLAPDTIIANGAGNFAAWLHRFWRYRRFATQVAPTSGTMGYGLPAAIAAKLAFPTAPVVCFSGDGDFQMTGMEFSTAVQAEAAVVVLVIDNGIYGTIRMHQERAYPGRVIATRLENPDFAALAVACGGYGERVETTDDFGPAFDRAVASGKPAILHLLIDPRAIAPGKVLPEG